MSAGLTALLIAILGPTGLAATIITIMGARTARKATENAAALQVLDILSNRLQIENDRKDRRIAYLEKALEDERKHSEET